MEIKIVTDGNWESTYIEVDGKVVSNLSRISLWAGNDRTYQDDPNYVELSYTTTQTSSPKEEGERAMTKEVTMRLDSEEQVIREATQQEVVEIERKDRVRKIFFTQEGDGTREKVAGYIG